MSSSSSSNYKKQAIREDEWAKLHGHARPLVDIMLIVAAADERVCQYIVNHCVTIVPSSSSSSLNYHSTIGMLLLHSFLVAYDGTKSTTPARIHTLVTTSMDEQRMTYRNGAGAGRSTKSSSSSSKYTIAGVVDATMSADAFDIDLSVANVDSTMKYIHLAYIGMLREERNRSSTPLTSDSVAFFALPPVALFSSESSLDARDAMGPAAAADDARALVTATRMASASTLWMHSSFQVNIVRVMKQRVSTSTTTTTTTTAAAVATMEPMPRPIPIPIPVQTSSHHHHHHQQHQYQHTNDPGGTRGVSDGSNGQASWLYMSPPLPLPLPTSPSSYFHHDSPSVYSSSSPFGPAAMMHTYHAPRIDYNDLMPPPSPPPDDDERDLASPPRANTPFDGRRRTPSPSPPTGPWSSSLYTLSGQMTPTSMVMMMDVSAPRFNYEHTPIPIDFGGESLLIDQDCDNDNDAHPLSTIPDVISISLQSVTSMIASNLVPPSTTTTTAPRAFDQHYNSSSAMTYAQINNGGAHLSPTHITNVDVDTSVYRVKIVNRHFLYVVFDDVDSFRSMATAAVVSMMWNNIRMCDVMSENQAVAMFIKRVLFMTGGPDGVTAALAARIALTSAYTNQTIGQFSTNPHLQTVVAMFAARVDRLIDTDVVVDRPFATTSALATTSLFGSTESVRSSNRARANTIAWLCNRTITWYITFHESAPHTFATEVVAPPPYTHATIGLMYTRNGMTGALLMNHKMTEYERTNAAVDV